MARVFGHIPGVEVGAVFPDRAALKNAGIHNEIQAGIAGSQTEGSESIVVSGGYEDDVDNGDVIIYTGSGGRKSDERVQTFDQELTRKNLALSRSGDEGFPVRVTRGYQGKNEYSPKSGYQYGGLYYVDDYWSEIGKSGFLIWRYRLVKDKQQPQLQKNGVEENSPVYEKEQSKRVEATVQRIVRNTQVATRVKAMYDYKCQVCGVRLEGFSGPYAEGAHIQGLGSPHNGPDVLENILCLCPNHHVLFDKGGFVINDDFSISGTKTNLTIHRNHHVNIEFLRFHRKLWNY